MLQFQGLVQTLYLRNMKFSIIMIRQYTVLYRYNIMYLQTELMHTCVPESVDYI